MPEGIMKQMIAIPIISFLFFSFGITGSQAAEVSISFHGQACFSIITSNGTTIVMDPIGNLGRIPYEVPKDIMADIVTVSHEHGDHNMVNAVSGKPVVVRGLDNKGKDFAVVDQEIKGVKVSTVHTYHDKEMGKKRGLNAVFLLEFDNIRVAHLGDLGHLLDKKQIQAIGDIDILLIPVGGGPTVGVEEAGQVVSQLNPKMLVIPMHCKTDVVTMFSYSAEDFVAKKQNVKRIQTNRYVLDLDNPPKQLEYVVMNYK
jgi:L-ascorbate metabolism protein UlaG (beta-lactamase superfamily)